MAYEKRRLREVDTAGSYSKVQTLTESDASTSVPSINSYGYSIISVTSTSTAIANDVTFALAAPKAGGVHKYISAVSASTDAIIVTTHSTEVTFFGSTNATVTATTGAAARHLELIATSSTGWAVIAQSTGWTFSA